MDCFPNGLSMDVILVNWMHAKQVLSELGVEMPQRVIDGVCNYKDGAAELLLEQLYRHFTGQQIVKVKSTHRVDFTDHAYQVHAVFTDHH